MKKKYKLTSIDTKEQAIKEAYRYLQNAKDTLAKIPIEDGIYMDSKYVREASGIAYLAPLLAIDGYLIGKGVPKSKLPKSTEHYWEVIPKIPYNAKLRNKFTSVYENLHLFGYYRGGVNVEMIKDGIKHAKEIVDMFKDAA
ncbi:MAG: DUF5618 family protein [Leptospiraceae bacterium]|nr:DUF5618 family protein [Leptospiraceae bacterium]